MSRFYLDVLNVICGNKMTNHKVVLRNKPYFLKLDMSTLFTDIRTNSYTKSNLLVSIVKGLLLVYKFGTSIVIMIF